jgi:hypothetical protein
MELVLQWRGPVGPGLFPGDIDGREALSAAGVYLRVKPYESGRLVGYVGQSKNLLQRFDQHLTQILSLNVPLRDETGLPVDTGDRLSLLNALGESGPLALAEARRTRFFFARAEDGFDADYLTLLEAVLKERADAMLGGACENVQTIAAGAFDHDLDVIHDFSLLNADGLATIQSVIGADPIRIPAVQEFDHAG